jgi:arsenate reductase-like glutaredoxin family protein
MPKSSTKVTPSTPTLNKQQSISEISENNSSSSSYSDDDLEGPHDLAHVLRKQTKCKELLKKFRAYYISVKKPEVIVNNSDSMEFMHEIFMNIKYLIKESKDQINSLDLLSDTDLVSIFVEVFDYCFLGLSLTTGKKGNLYEDVLKMHHYLNSLSQLVWCLTNFSSKFRINFHSCDGTRSLLQFIQNKKVVENFIIYKRNDLLQMDPKYSLMKALIGSLHNLSKTVSFEGFGFNSINYH